MSEEPSFDEIFRVMAAASVGDEAARVALPDDPGQELTTRFGVALNLLLDELAFRADRQRRILVERHEARARSEAIVDMALDAIVGMDASGIINEWNPAAERTFGWSREEAIGRPLAELIVPPAAREAHVAGVKRYVETGVPRHPGRRLELPALRRDGAEITVELSLAGIVGDPPSFIGSIRDITEKRLAEEARRKLEEQLQQAQKMEAVGRLAGGVAHDFNNLLAVILGYGSSILGSLAPDDPLRDDVAEICRAGDRAAELTRRLLTFSRQKPVEPKLLDLNALIDDMSNMLRRALGVDAELILRLSRPIGTILADAGSLEQAILNLVVNAADAMPSGGEVFIETDDVVLDDAYALAHLGVRPGPHVMLTVRDTGVGMDRATQARIFEPFFTTKPPGKGTGLGLSTVFGIARQSGGSIALESEPGHGATFRLYFPRAEAVAAPAAPRPRAHAPAGSETILLVEDEEQVRRMTRTVLERAGYLVLEARDGVEALALADAHAGPLHLLLTDVVMPHMSGPELARRLLARHPEMAVLCVSGYADDGAMEAARADPRISFLQKPSTPDELRRKLREILDGRQATRSAG